VRKITKKENTEKIDGLFEIVNLFRLSILFNYGI